MHNIMRRARARRQQNEAEARAAVRHTAVRVTVSYIGWNVFNKITILREFLLIKISCHSSCKTPAGNRRQTQRLR
jgi:hypothetical protein